VVTTIKTPWIKLQKCVVTFFQVKTTMDHTVDVLPRNEEPRLSLMQEITTKGNTEDDLPGMWNHSTRW
jgi:hypothetical protein